jgi:hypothetical protein
MLGGLTSRSGPELPLVGSRSRRAQPGGRLGDGRLGGSR